MTYDTQGRRVLQGHPSTWPQEVEQLKAENERLKLELHEASETIDAVWFALDDADPDRAADAVQAFFRARAALQKQEGGQ